jgi:hypothetical protein
MVRTAQQQRTRQSAIIARAILVIIKELRRAYRPRQRNVGRVFQELIVAMAFQLRNERNRTPSTIRAIAQLACLPYANTHRAIVKLRREHIVRKQDRGYVGDGGHIMARMEARHFNRIVGAIVGAAGELRLVQKNA